MCTRLSVLLGAALLAGAGAGGCEDDPAPADTLPVDDGGGSPEPDGGPGDTGGGEPAPVDGGADAGGSIDLEAYLEEHDILP